jgi:hypothetical protein
MRVKFTDSEGNLLKVEEMEVTKGSDVLLVALNSPNAEKFLGHFAMVLRKALLDEQPVILTNPDEVKISVVREVTE